MDAVLPLTRHFQPDIVEELLGQGVQAWGANVQRGGWGVDAHFCLGLRWPAGAPLGAVG